MITEHDLNAAIAECQGKPNPDAKTCMMLAAFYTIRNEMFGEKAPEKFSESYSFASAPDNVIDIDGDSEFVRLVNGRKQKEIFPVIDELMDVLNTIQPRLYNAVMDKLA